MKNEKLKQISSNFAAMALLLYAVASIGLSFEHPRVNAVVAIIAELAFGASLVLTFLWGNNYLKTFSVATLIALPIALFFTPFNFIDVFIGLTLNQDLTSHMQPIEQNHKYNLYQYVDDRGQTKILSEYKVFPGVKFSKVMTQYAL